MQLIFASCITLGGIAVYFVLLGLGIYRLYPLETYAMMLLGVILSARAARQRAGWWRYAIASLNGLLFLVILGWTLLYSKLPTRPIPFSIGQSMPIFSLPDQDGRVFSTAGLRGRIAALYLFYRGDW